MNEMIGLRGVEPREILQTAIDKKTPAIMSYLSKGKWHVAKVLFTDLGVDRFSIQSIHRLEKLHPINIQLEQPVGISFKYEYGKFIFDTTVLGLEPPSNPSTEQRQGGTIILAVPNCVEVIQRRSYFRVNVPESLKVNVVLWHRRQSSHAEAKTPDRTAQIHNYYQGRLVDISAGGAQVVIDTTLSAPPPTGGQEPDFKEGQFIGLRFTPLPYETPLMFNAQIRHLLPTIDRKSIFLGLQIVGLESSYEGRQVLSRLVGIVERYYRMNRSTRQPASTMV
jgi:hypothetical protein